MAKKHFGTFIAFAAAAGTVAAGISYFLRYRSFHDELDEDFHDFEDEFDDFEDAGEKKAAAQRSYVSLTPDKPVKDPAEEVKEAAKDMAAEAGKMAGEVKEEIRKGAEECAEEVREEVKNLTAKAAEAAEAVKTAETVKTAEAVKTNGTGTDGAGAGEVPADTTTIVEDTTE